MYGLLLTLLILDGVVLMVIILLQAGKGGGLAAMGGGMGTDNTLIGGRQAATVLTKSTWITGGLFLFLSLMLSIVSSSSTGAPDSILQQEFQQTQPAQPQPVLPGAEPQGGDQGGPPSGDAGAAEPQPITPPSDGS